MQINWNVLSPVIWLVLGIAFAVIEGLTVQLTSIWFAVGAAVTAAVAAIFHISGQAQFWTFLIISVLLLAATRPFARRKLQVKKVNTNADRVIGQVGVVISAIDNLQAAGRVKVSGLDWSARSRSGDPIAEGCRVRVLAIDGVKLIVEPVE